MVRLLAGESGNTRRASSPAKPVAKFPQNCAESFLLPQMVECRIGAEGGQSTANKDENADANRCPRSAQKAGSGRCSEERSASGSRAEHGALLDSFPARSVGCRHLIDRDRSGEEEQPFREFGQPHRGHEDTRPSTAGRLDDCQEYLVSFCFRQGIKFALEE